MSDAQGRPGTWGESDPVRKAAQHAAPERLKRFYAAATVGPVADGRFPLLLDERQARTPAKAVLAAPNRPVAEAIAAEWNAQGTFIEPKAMPLTRLVNTALDGVATAMAETRAGIVAFGETDLVCYRAPHPQELIERQAAAWNPVVAFVAAETGVRPTLVEGVMHVAQPPELADALDRAIGSTDAFRLAALFTIASLTGSTFLALAADRRYLEPDSIWEAAHVDEDWQIAQWGEDAEAARRRAYRRTEFDAAMLVLTAAE